MKVLVTGAAGFVGSWLSDDLREHGHTVIRARRHAPGDGRGPPDGEWVQLDVERPATCETALRCEPDAIVHLAAVASGAAAFADPARAWRVNALGTMHLLQAVEASALRPRILIVSTGEVYGAGLTTPALEDDRLFPCSPYAASKMAAEIGAGEAHRRAKLDLVIVRPFAQTGPGQLARYVVPAFARRILEAKERGRSEVRVGNLSPIREFLDVRDVVAAMRLVVERGESGSVYNIARGQGCSLHDVFSIIAELADWDGRPVPDPTLFRPADVSYLVGDGAKLERMGWAPRWEFRQTLRDVIEGIPDLPGE